MSELKTVDSIFCFYFSFTFTSSFILKLGASMTSHVTVTPCDMGVTNHMTYRTS